MDINCLLHCKFQDNGKCSLDNLENVTGCGGWDGSADCMYFDEKEENTRK